MGNLDAKRDWGHAREYVRGMWLMLQQEVADDYVLATGKTVTVREFVDMAFKNLGIDIEWKGKGVNEKGYETATGRLLIEVDERYFRPTEVDLLLGDPTKAKNKLGWVAETTLQDLVGEMVQADLKIMKNELSKSET